MCFNVDKNIVVKIQTVFLIIVGGKPTLGPLQGLRWPLHRGHLVRRSEGLLLQVRRGHRRVHPQALQGVRFRHLPRPRGRAGKNVVVVEITKFRCKLRRLIFRRLIMKKGMFETIQPLATVTGLVCTFKNVNSIESKFKY